MEIKNLKKYATIFGLTSALVLTTCKNEYEIVDINIEKMEEIETNLDMVSADYDYENKYLTDDNLFIFKDYSEYDTDCVVELITDDISVLSRNLVDRIEFFSRYLLEKYTTSYNLYLQENYSDYYKKMEYGHFSYILYETVCKMFENTPKDEWANLYCKLSNTAITFSDDFIRRESTVAVTVYTTIRDSEFEKPITGNLIVINDSRLVNIAEKKCLLNDEVDYDEIYLGLFYDTLAHELEHCKQNNCSCYYHNMTYLNYFNRILDIDFHQLRSEFLTEAGAVTNSINYYDSKYHIYSDITDGAYEEELETAKLIENTIMLRDDYMVNDIYDSNVASNPKKINNWLDIDNANEEDYRKIFNIVASLNISNSNNKEVFDWLTDKEYGSINHRNAKRMLLRSDALIDLMTIGYKNLIYFNEKNKLNYEAFIYLLEKYQTFYLESAEFISDFDRKSYWSNEFIEKYNLTNEVLNQYIGEKYKNVDNIKEKIDIVSELKNALGNKYDILMENISCDEEIRDRFENRTISLDELVDVKVKVK